MKSIVKAIRLLFAIILIVPMLVLVTLFILVFSAPLRLVRLNKASDKVRNFFLDFMVTWIFIFLGTKVTIIGKENLPKRGSKYCFIPNHNSAIDIPAVYATYRWPGMVAKKELYAVPIINVLLWSLRCVKLDRTSAKAAIDAIHKGVENIDKGNPMVIFPEGTRSKNGVIGTFKAGSFKMATRSKCLVVPVVLKNTRQALESAYHFGFVKIYVEILPPIDTSDMNPDELKALPEKVEIMIKEAYSKLPVWPKEK